MRKVTSRAHLPIRIVIADDQAAFREGLHVALHATDAEIDIVGEASTGEEALTLVQELRPDVVVLDVRMPGSGGISAARAIAAAVPRTRILMLTVSDDASDVAKATGAGAAGYLLKYHALEDIADAVVALSEGRSVPAETG